MTYIGCLDLGVPAVACIVSHLVVHVLSKPQALGVDTDEFEEEESTSHEISERLVGYETLLHHRHPR